MGKSWPTIALLTARLSWENREHIPFTFNVENVREMSRILAKHDWQILPDNTDQYSSAPSKRPCNWVKCIGRGMTGAFISATLFIYLRRDKFFDSISAAYKKIFLDNPQFSCFWIDTAIKRQLGERAMFWSIKQIVVRVVNCFRMT